MIVRRDFVTVPGTYIFSSPFIYAVNLLGVERDGLGQTNISDPAFEPTPVNREFIYSGSSIEFSVYQPFNPGEKLTVLYEI